MRRKTRFYWAEARHNAKLRATKANIEANLGHKIRMVGFRLPAGPPTDGGSCYFAGSCLEPCFARGGRFAQPSVRWPATENLVDCKRILQPVTALGRERGIRIDDLAENLIADLRILQPDYVRLHVDGDFFRIGYTRAWAKAISESPGIVFYGYTKAISWYQQYLRGIPNLRMAQSYGGTMDGMIDLGYGQVAKVFRTVDDIRAAGYTYADTDCPVILGYKRIGLLFHGSHAKSARLTKAAIDSRFVIGKAPQVGFRPGDPFGAALGPAHQGEIVNIL